MNAGAAEEMASTSEDLSSQAEQLRSTISFFKAGEADAYRSKAGIKRLEAGPANSYGVVPRRVGSAMKRIEQVT
jgi:methyl-accepting chemotaxis protein